MVWIKVNKVHIQRLIKKGIDIMKLKHRFKVLKEVAVVTYKEWSVYRTHSMVSIFVGPVYFIVQYYIWNAVYHDKANINGMDLAQTLTYFGISALLSYLLMDFADWNLQMLVRTGKFLTFALRPLHHRFFALSQKFGHRVLGFIIEFVPCYIIFYFLFDIKLVPKYPVWAIISIILAFFMNFYVNYTIGMTAFWLVQANGIRQVYQLLANLFSGTLIPLLFFPKVLQKAMFFLPFQYTSYVPIMVFTGSYSLGGVTMSIPEIVGLQAVVLVLMIGLSEFIYRISIKRFCGVGA